MQEDGTRRAIAAAFLANLGIAGAKFAGFFITGAASMLAEAVHSLADTGNQGLLMLGATRAKREATLEHPFGFGRERYFWAFVVALVLFSLGSLFAIHEGVDKLLHPHELVSPAVAIGILAVRRSHSRLVVSHRCRREAQPLRGSMSWWSFIRRSKSPELPVVLLEDLGALLGLVIALLGVTLSAVFGDPRFDAIGSIGIGALLGVIAIVLASEMKSLLIGESAAKEIRSAIRTHRRRVTRRSKTDPHANPSPGSGRVARRPQGGIRRCQPRHSGLASAIDDVESAIRQQTPTARVIYVEPDVVRSASG